MNTTTSPTTNQHAVTINCEQPSRSGALMLNGGFRASCSCGWSSDCYSQLSDTERATQVHLRRSQRVDIDALIAKSSIGAAIADVKKRGIDAHLIDLERAMNRRPKRERRKERLSAEDAAFMRGFGAALASIYRCHHDGQMVRQLIKENNFKLTSFKDVGMLPADLAAIRQAVQR